MFECQNRARKVAVTGGCEVKDGSVEPSAAAGMEQSVGQPDSRIECQNDVVHLFSIQANSEQTGFAG